MPHRSRNRSPKWTLILIAAAVLAFIIQSIVGPGRWVWFAFTPALAVDMPWTFLTSIFLHGGFSHLFFNMIALFFFGIYLERMVGRRRFLALFFAAGIVGNLGYMATTDNPWVPAVGASGAVYGVIGVLTALRPTLLVFLGGLPMPLVVAAFFWALLDFAGLFAPTGIAHGAHLTGLFLGAAYGVYLRVKS